jgi:hypothetical protein
MFGGLAASRSIQLLRRRFEERLRVKYAIPAIGIAKSRNSKLPDPPSGDRPNSRSMKSISASSVWVNNNNGAGAPAPL